MKATDRKQNLLSNIQLLHKRIGNGILETQGRILGMTDMTVGHIGHHCKGLIRIQYIRPGHGLGPLVEILGTMAIQKFQGRNNLLNKAGAICHPIQHRRFRIKIQTTKTRLDL